MIYKISGEQPFQVLSTSFTVSPSESGYDLYLSADGFEYSYFITVPSGITKQLVQMNNGNYYKLIGNTSIVSVNWERDCHGGGGGGTAGVSSLDGQTGALTTKTINGNAILGSGDIVISGGTGGQKVIDLNALTQQERAALYTELNANSGSANEDYLFYYSSNNTYISEYSNKPLRYQVVQFGEQIKFILTIGRQDAAYFVVLNVNLKQDGTITSGYNIFNTAQKASVSSLGMVKVGSGLTIDGSGVLSVSGGTGGSNNYQIVDDLSEVQNPQAGTKVYVRSGSTTETYNGFSFDGTQISEGYVGTVQRNGNTIWTIYRSGTDFYWGWNNDGNIHSAEQDGETCFYMCDTQNGIFYIFIGDLNGVTAVPAENATTGSTSTGITISWESQSLIYTGAEYVATSDVIYDLDSMTQSERASLVNYLLASTDIERIGAHIYKDHMKCRFDHIEDGKINLNCHYIDRGNAYPEIKTENFFIKSDGSYEADDIQNFGVTVNAWVNYNDTGHTLQTTNISLWGIGRSVKRCNLNIILTTGSSIGEAVVTAPAIVERTGDWTGNFYVTFIYDGKKIEASWSFDENTPTTTKWVETPL